jgi:hypothetical protein
MDALRVPQDVRRQLLCTVTLFIGEMSEIDSPGETASDTKTRERGNYGQFQQRRPDAGGAPLPMV